MRMFVDIGFYFGWYFWYVSRMIIIALGMPWLMQGVLVQRTAVIATTYKIYEPTKGFKDSAVPVIGIKMYIIEIL